MKGFAYLDVEGNLWMKDWEYITTENPTFWSDNSHFILKVWPFDTTNRDQMHRMYSDFKDLGLRRDPVIEFSKSINFQIESLKR